MRKVTTLLFLVISAAIVKPYTSKAQNPCDASPVVVTDVFPPNTISTPTNSGNQYLCGKNTVVYDTLPMGCILALVNGGSNLFVKTTCNAVHQVWVKNTGTLTIPVGGAGLFSIVLEPGAVFNNLSGYTIATTTCASITFPIVSCPESIPTGLKEDFVKTYKLKTGPNPAIDHFFIELETGDNPVTVSLYNLPGALICTKDFDNTGFLKFDVNALENGTYLLSVKTGNRIEHKKIVVLH